MSRSPSVLCGTLLLFAQVRSPLAAAPAAGTDGRRVELVVATADESHSLEAPIRDLLRAKELELVSARKEAITPEDVAAAAAVSPDRAVVARAFVDLTVPRQATLFLIDPRRGRVHVRRIAVDRGLDAVARASALFVIEQSIDAILEGREIGVTREEYERSVAPPPPPAPPSPRPGPETPPRGPELGLAAGYEGVAAASGTYLHAAKIAFATRFSRFHVAAAARLAAPLSIAGDGVEARLSGGGLSLSGAARVLGLGNLSLFGGLGVALDMTRIQPEVTAADLQAEAAFWSTSPSLRPFVEVEHRIGRLSLAIAIGAEAHLFAERYTVRTDGATREVFVPRRLRPLAAALVGVVF